MLSVNGVLGGVIDVLTGGRLQGSGNVGDIRISGTVAPGNSIGTLNVAGNVSFAAGSIYEVEANADGRSDKIVASGNGAIGGGTVRVRAADGNYRPQTDYVILTAMGGVTGAFGDVTSNLAFLDPTLRYDATNVYLRLRRNDISFASIGVTANQVATGGGVEKLGWDNPLFDAVVNLSADQARQAFDQLSGDIHASVRTAMAEDSRLVRTAIADRLRMSVDGDPRGFWGTAIGSWGHTGTDGNAARLDRSTSGLLMGIDFAAGEGTRLGIVWGYDHSEVDLDQRAATGKIDGYHFGAYAGRGWGALTMRAGIAYSWQDIHTNRQVTFAGIADAPAATYGGGTFQSFGELSYALHAGAATLEPYIEGVYVRARTNEFAETGGDAKLSGARSALDVTFTTLGLRAANDFNLGGARATVRLGGGWRHAFGDVAPVTAMRYLAGSATFAITGLPVARNTAALDAGLDVALSDRASIGISYTGQFGDRMSEQAAKASLRWTF